MTNARMFIDQADVRGAERRDAITGGTLRTSPSTPIDVTIVNLSTTGVAIETDQDLTIGETISIGIPGIGSHRAGIVRKTQAGYGCEFLKPIDSAGVAAAGIDTIAVLPGGSLDPDAFPPPHIVPWSPRARLIFGLALASGLWVAILAMARAIG